MTHQQKMAEAIQRAYDKGLIKKEIIEQLPSVEDLVIGIVALTAILTALGIGAAAFAGTGVGLLLEGIALIIVAALLAIGFFTAAKQIIGGLIVLGTFYYDTMTAKSMPELDAAGQEFAEGISKVGVGIINGILTYVGGRAGAKTGKGFLDKWMKWLRGKSGSAGQGPPPPSRPGIGPAYSTEEEAKAAAEKAYQELKAKTNSEKDAIRVPDSSDAPPNRPSIDPAYTTAEDEKAYAWWQAKNNWNKDPIRLPGSSNAPPNLQSIGQAYATEEEAEAAYLASSQERWVKSGANARYPHFLGVEVRNPSGKITHKWWELSEEGVGNPQNPLLGHTEQKALARLFAMGVEPGTTIIFRGGLPPCKFSGGCTEAMNAFIKKYGVNILYDKDGTHGWFDTPTKH